MKKIFKISCLTITLFLFANTLMAQENISQGNTEIKVIIKLKVAGMNSQKDAETIDNNMQKYKFVLKSKTDFKTGIAEISTSSEDYKEKIKEAICANWQVIGNNISVEVVEIIRK